MALMNNIKDWKKILETDHVIEKITYTEDSVVIYFENLKEKLYIDAVSECCDYNEFLKLENINSLVGCKINSIIEGECFDVDHNNENGYEDVVIQFPITIKYENKKLLEILKELKQKSYLWKKLPKDIFNLLKDMILYEEEFVFYRQNTSNGYYSGYLEISLKV